MLTLCFLVKLEKVHYTCQLEFYLLPTWIHLQQTAATAFWKGEELCTPRRISHVLRCRSRVQAVESWNVMSDKVVLHSFKAGWHPWNDHYSMSWGYKFQWTSLKKKEKKVSALRYKLPHYDKERLMSNKVTHPTNPPTLNIWQQRGLKSNSRATLRVNTKRILVHGKQTMNNAIKTGVNLNLELIFE